MKTNIIRLLLSGMLTGLCLTCLTVFGQADRSQTLRAGGPFFPPPKTGNGNIRGLVVEAGTFIPVPRAQVDIQKDQGTRETVFSDADGSFLAKEIPEGIYTIEVSKAGYELFVEKAIKVIASKDTFIYVGLTPVVKKEEEAPLLIQTGNLQTTAEVMEYKVPLFEKGGNGRIAMMGGSIGLCPYNETQKGTFNTESYDVILDNSFREVITNPVSTFSADVDRASYSNVRRFLNNNTFPPKDAVRIEELINYFDYDYPQPVNRDPFAVTVEMGQCPWNSRHDLLLIGIKGKEMLTDKIPPTNLVFLIDVSGSMDEPNKLPLLKQAFRILIGKLRQQDQVAMVVYAGAAGCVLESTHGNEKEKIMTVLDQLEAGGSTAGGAGIQAAYKIARQNYIPGGNNRVILATDGDFNIGASSDAEMVRLIEEKRKEGIFLTVLGFGMENYKDSKMEKIADAGNGNYAYIDNILEAKKIFSRELWNTLYTIAKDVKIQVEFNPEQVEAYRLVGYENRMLNREDFNDDKKDAGDIGNGHTVTVLYEIIQPGSKELRPEVDPLEYQRTNLIGGPNLMTLKLRYKEPDSDSSRLLLIRTKGQDIYQKVSSDNFTWAAAVAEFGMLLRDSEYKGDASYEHVMIFASAAIGNDTLGYRRDFLKLVETASLLVK